ncbi:testis-specific serine/threonine-protein kinase 3-like protein [Dinothrombium tinctorium]|uniref:Testis-specific serine/threonine-protein kinase 3-like protein n=1 Tax=Dinothrombium tinctorium TaxID=1965070 RepID=A0A3S3PLC9_9ACAR|nr:testis-specific serine/threonine-protein kinase 3-like protein [Dinothrombium tinctorium]RWS03789.1 testis-specific serine/threonine-protein kinase 3-like protein [Dinothrombium tinctorium]RWS06410.1 testis-specific serine/threonine-protein kinase 3-like protein [Dinothrombium tinctorium]
MDIVLSKETIDNLRKKGYEMKRKLGSGSYGCVQLAFSKPRNQNVAMKIIESSRINQQYISKFLNREIEVLRSIKPHSHIVKFYEFDKSEKYFFIVIEYCENGDIYDYIRTHRNLPEAQACFWFKQLIAGVEHIHNEGFAHRDLKCENLLLDANYNVKITDFGFACKLKREIKSQDKVSSDSLIALSITFCGSILYASPELLKCKPYDPTKSDIWSCGVILWVMIFGMYPLEEYRLKHAIETDDFTISMPDQPLTSDEFIEVINGIFADEKDRFTINQLKKVRVE